ncbi:MAG: hypothetical protein CSA70_10785 [Rhodobacterales bacterium]|nr:MAG: hypothetical protein CSA70_10785 [Rhodobacterales bacterium]
MTCNLTYLLADIGGTNSRFALSRGAALERDTIASFRNDGMPSPGAALTRYVHKVNPARIDRVCLAAAGPVLGDRITLTNRNWQISAGQIAALTGCDDIRFINDLQAMGYALADEDLTGRKPAGTRLVLAIGTGTNCAVLYESDGRRFVPPAEAGYIALPHIGARYAPVLDKLAEQFGTPVIEAALSGPNLPALHRAVTGETQEPAHILSRANRTPSLELILRIFGATLGTLALTHLPRDGIFLAGSVGVALFQWTRHPAFTSTYLDRGPYRDLVKDIAIRDIKDEFAPLVGAARLVAQT